MPMLGLGSSGYLISQTLASPPVPACVVSSWKLCTILRSWSRLKWVAGSPAVTLSTSGACAVARPGMMVPVSEVRVSGEPGPRVSTGRVTRPPPGRDIETMEPGYEGGGGRRLESEAVSTRDSSTWGCQGYQRSSGSDLKHTQVEDRGRGRGLMDAVNPRIGSMFY